MSNYKLTSMKTAGRTSGVVLDRRQPRTQPQPLRRVKVSRLRRGDHPDDEHPIALVRQRVAAGDRAETGRTVLLTWPPWRL